MMKKKIALVLTLTLLCAFALSACASAPAAPAAPSGGGEALIPVTMYGVPDPQISAAQTIAYLKGFYKDEGLDVTLNLVANSTEIGPMLANGTAQIGFANNYSMITWRASDIDLRVVATNCNMAGTQAAALRKDITIKSPKDLEGMTVGVLRNSEIEIAMRRMCDEYGLDYSKFKLVPLQGADMLSALEAGNIEIMAAWEPWVTKAEKLGHKFLMSGNKSAIPGAEGDKPWINVYSTMNVPASYIKENPDVIKRVMRAVNTATDFINNNREEAVSLLSEKFNIDKDDLRSIMTRNIYKFGVYDEYKESTDWLENYLLENDVITKHVNFDDYNDFSLLKEAIPSVYTITK